MAWVISAMKSGAVLTLMLGLSAGLAGYAQADRARKSVTVKLNQKEIVHTHWIQMSQRLKPDSPCQNVRAPNLVLRKKPKLGNVKIR